MGDSDGSQSDDDLPTITQVNTMTDDTFDRELPQWQQDVADDIQAYTKKWVTQFVQDKTAWKAVPDGVNQRDTEFYVTTLTKRIYDQYRKTPKTWTKKAITGVLTGYFVSNISMPPEDYIPIGPTLTAFVDFVGKKGFVRSIISERAHRAIAEAAPKMVKLAQNPKNYGPAKEVGTAMMAANVDPSDPEAVNAFMDRYNQITQTQQALKGQQYNYASVYHPDEQYKEMPHTETIGQRHWRLATATRFHHQLTEYAWDTWANVDELNKEYSQADVSQAIITLGDALYAQYLESPKTWQSEHFREVFADIIKRQAVPNLQALPASWEHLLHRLIDTAKIPKKLGEALIAEVRSGAKAVPKVSTPGHLQGKVISMKTYKRQLKKRKRRR